MGKSHKTSAKGEKDHFMSMDASAPAAGSAEASKGSKSTAAFDHSAKAEKHSGDAKAEKYISEHSAKTSKIFKTKSAKAKSSKSNSEGPSTETSHHETSLATSAKSGKDEGEHTGWSSAKTPATGSSHDGESDATTEEIVEMPEALPDDGTQESQDASPDVEDHSMSMSTPSADEVTQDEE